MSICMFNYDNGKSMQCEYRIIEGNVIIEVKYDISEEIKDANGVCCYSTNTTINARDIIIIDSQIILLVKNAHYRSSGFGAYTTRFVSRTYFVLNNMRYADLFFSELQINKIRIYSKDICNIIKNHSLDEYYDDEFRYLKLSLKPVAESIDISKNNIGTITVADFVTMNCDCIKNSREINICGYFEIVLSSFINLEEVDDYVNELIIFLQLYKADAFEINKVELLVGEYFFEYHFPLLTVNKSVKDQDVSVKDELLPFLKKCYDNIPYRDSAVHIRNIRYIVLSKPRVLEEYFLMSFRFIECFYKNVQKTKKNPLIIEAGINNHYHDNQNRLSNIWKATEEIVGLRNHYVHSGYYIKDNKLSITKYDKKCLVENGKSKKSKRIVKVDSDWIYDRANILHKVVIDIIFREYLGYSEYKYE